MPPPKAPNVGDTNPIPSAYDCLLQFISLGGHSASLERNMAIHNTLDNLFSHGDNTIQDAFYAAGLTEPSELSESLAGVWQHLQGRINIGGPSEELPYSPGSAPMEPNWQEPPVTIAPQEPPIRAISQDPPTGTTTQEPLISTTPQQPLAVALQDLTGATHEEPAGTTGQEDTDQSPEDQEPMPVDDGHQEPCQPRRPSCPHYGVNLVPAPCPSVYPPGIGPSGTNSNANPAAATSNAPMGGPPNIVPPAPSAPTGAPPNVVPPAPSAPTGVPPNTASSASNDNANPGSSSGSAGPGKDIAPLTEHAMAPWLDGTFEAFSPYQQLRGPAPTTDPKALLEPVLQKLGPRTAAVYGLGTATDRRSCLKLVVSVILETYGSTPGPFRNAYASHAWDCWQKAPSWPTRDAEWTEFFGEVRKSFREDIVLKHVAKVCLDLAEKLIVSLNMSTLRHQIDGTLQAGMMDFLKGASSFSHHLLLLRFVIAFCDLHCLIVQNTRRQTALDNSWRTTPEAAKLQVGATTDKVKMWPLDAALDKWGWFMLFRSRMSDIGLAAHIDTLEAAQPGTLKFIQSPRKPAFVSIFRHRSLCLIKGGRMLYKSGIDGTRDITPEAVLADEASASVIAIRTLFAEQALDSFTTTPELEAQREELLKYVNKVLESRVGEASQSPNGLDKQLHRALEGANQDRFPGSSNFAGPPRPIAGRQRALSAANRGMLMASSADAISPGSLSTDQHPIISKGLWHMVDAFTAKPGLWARIVAEAMGSAFS
ncbi:hypothetical protein FA13DRAFT_1719667 [Coprinellus micaceus]|uniref:Uncharacterized protein n=1 Tax=Coprinellus micaceus TaxID=71717 RepID=A0A4Y7SB53_COPMI|nr:hypothetical protein FA13DRAFT_1719667 [Coprinellus micaceus]